MGECEVAHPVGKLEEAAFVQCMIPLTLEKARAGCSSARDDSPELPEARMGRARVCSHVNARASH